MDWNTERETAIKRLNDNGHKCKQPSLVRMLNAIVKHELGNQLTKEERTYLRTLIKQISKSLARKLIAASNNPDESKRLEFLKKLIKQKNRFNTGESNGYT